MRVGCINIIIRNKNISKIIVETVRNFFWITNNSIIMSNISDILIFYFKREFIKLQGFLELPEFMIEFSKFLLSSRLSFRKE